MADDLEKRKHDRVDLQGHIADIADGNFIYGGIIKDISSGGLMLTSLPTKFAVEGRTYSIVISGGSSGTNFKLVVQPRWKRIAKSGHAMDVGFKIVEAPWEWSALVNKMIPETEADEEDVWDQYSGR